MCPRPNRNQILIGLQKCNRNALTINVIVEKLTYTNSNPKGRMANYLNLLVLRYTWDV